MKGQAEHIAGLISLASLILLAYVAGNVTLELQKLGRQLSGEVLASKELLEVVRVNETHIKIRSRWDGDSWVRYVILCDAYVCNLISVDTYVPRRGSAVTASLNGLGVANQICVVTANENMFCADSNTASVQELNRALPQPRMSWYVVERVPPTYAISPTPTGSGIPSQWDYNVTRLWVWRQNKYPLVSNEGLYIYAYPADGAFLVTELDDVLLSLHKQGIINISISERVSNATTMFDHDDSTSAFVNADTAERTYIIIDLGQVYTSGVLVITTFPSTHPDLLNTHATLYFGATLYEPVAYSILYVSTFVSNVGIVKVGLNGTVAYLLDSIPGGVRYIWLNATLRFYIASLELYLPSSYKSYIIAADPLVPQGLNLYPRTITALAVPKTSLRIIEET